MFPEANIPASSSAPCRKYSKVEKHFCPDFQPLKPLPQSAFDLKFHENGENKFSLLNDSFLQTTNEGKFDGSLSPNPFWDSTFSRRDFTFRGGCFSDS